MAFRWRDTVLIISLRRTTLKSPKINSPTKSPKEDNFSKREEIPWSYIAPKSILYPETPLYYISLVTETRHWLLHFINPFYFIRQKESVALTLKWLLQRFIRFLSEKLKKIASFNFSMFTLWFMKFISLKVNMLKLKIHDIIGK